MNEKPAPATFHGIKMFSMEGNAGAYNLHVEGTVIPDSLTWTEWNAVLLFQCYFLFKKEVHKFLIRRELVAQFIYYFTEEIVECFFP